MSSETAIAVQMDAKRGEWFGGIYQNTKQGVIATEGARLWSDKAWKEASDGLTTIDARDWETHPPVEKVLTIAAEQYCSGQRPLWNEVLPFYGRKPPIHQG